MEYIQVRKVLLASRFDDKAFHYKVLIVPRYLVQKLIYMIDNLMAAV